MKKIQEDDIPTIKVREQCIEVSIRDGKTVTKYEPTNSEMDLEMRDDDPQIDFIIRHITFHDGVPAEYRWTEPDPLTALTGGSLFSFCTISEWPELMQAEFYKGHALLPGNPQAHANQSGPFPYQNYTRNRRAENN